jgi:hypothetical protein
MVTLMLIITFCVTCRSKVQIPIVKKCTLAGLWLGETLQFDRHTYTYQESKIYYVLGCDYLASHSHREKVLRVLIVTAVRN